MRLQGREAAVGRFAEGRDEGERACLRGDEDVVQFVVLLLLRGRGGEWEGVWASVGAGVDGRGFEG